MAESNRYWARRRIMVAWVVIQLEAEHVHTYVHTYIYLYVAAIRNVDSKGKSGKNTLLLNSSLATTHKVVSLIT